MGPIIYAILIGINDYPVSPLRGCVNDALAMEKFLSCLQPDPQCLKITKLIDAQATRENIIQSFDLFRSAGEKDTCLLYFSGHGSYTAAPPGFYNSTNRVHQTLVCWDSRRENGRDLMDKELAFLIWKHTSGLKKSPPSLVVITDSCHSGTVTRALVTGSLTARTVDPVCSQTPAADYYGFNEPVNGRQGYIKEHTPTGELLSVRVETGPHIHLAAARDRQTAKEDRIEGASGQVGGLFTYSLLRSLYSGNRLINYSELIRRAEIYLKTLVADQVPVLNLNSLPAGIAFRPFLQEDAAAGSFSNFLYYNALRGWCLDAGALQGANRSDRIVGEGGFSTAVLEVFPEESTIVSSRELRDVHTQIPVRLVPRTAIKFRLNETIGPEVQKRLTDECAKQYINEFSISEEGPGDYAIGMNASGTFAATLSDGTPLFKETLIDTPDGIALFADKLKRFSVWNRLLRLQNPLSSLSAADFALKLSVSCNGKYGPEDLIGKQDLSMPVVTRYYKEGEALSPPAFRLECRNTSPTELWFYPIAMGFDYSLDNNSFESFSLLPDHAASLTLKTKKGPTDIIKLTVGKEYRDLGYFEITERLKLIISTCELDHAALASWQQPGLHLRQLRGRGAEAIRGRGFGEETADYTEDWITTSLSFVVSYPQEN